jgi:acyl-CoA thioesterase I
MRRCRPLLVILSLLALAFLAVGTPLLDSPRVADAQSATPDPTARVIVAFGDSLTAGYGVTPAEAYPGRLHARLAAEGYRYRIVNAGVSGETTAGGLRRVDWALSVKPSIAIVALGANDGLRGQSPVEMERNLERIIERFQSGGARVLLAGMRLPANYGGRYAGEFGRAFAQAASRRGVVLVPFLLEGVGGNPSLNLPDGIHPTAEGHRIIADHLWPYLVPMLSK